MENVKPTKTLKDWKEVYRNGAETLIQYIGAPEKDLDWGLNVAGISLISQGKQTPIKDTEAYGWLKEQIRGKRSEIRSKEDLIHILETFVEKLK